MRKIKYRFFRARLKEMVYGFTGCSTTYVLSLWENEKHVSEPMQYTGLKDKNGADIYEGDIVEGRNRVFENVSHRYKVTFLNGCFMLGNWNFHEYFNSHQEIEVIGNTYENPDLL